MSRNGVSDAVNQILDEMGFLKLPLQNDLINYSALARFIEPLISEKMNGHKPSMDAVIMAIRRYVSHAEHRESEDLLYLLGNIKLVLRTGISVLHLKRSPALYAALVDIGKNKVNWHQGDKMNVIQRSEEITVIASHKLLPLIQEAAPHVEILHKLDDLAMLTLEYPLEANSTPGTISFISLQLESANVNIIAMYNTFTKMSLIVSEHDASKAYERLSKAFTECRKASTSHALGKART